jgi:FG-GAP repeat protein
LNEIVGLGYNAVYEDIREVTIVEGTTFTIAIIANDFNVSDVVTLSATGTAISSPDIIEGTYSLVAGAGTGVMDFSFKPGFLAVTGEAKSATFDLKIDALDGSAITPDTSKFVFNVIAKYATPIVTIESITVNGTSQPAEASLIDLKEGSSIEIVMTAQDPGNAVLTKTIEALPADVPATTEMTTDEAGIVTATFAFTADFQSSDVPEISYESTIDPLWSSFVVANASYSNKILIPIDIINVSQAPIISTTATVGIKEPVVITDGAIVSVEAGDQVVLTFNASDPDGDAVLTNLQPVVTAADDFTVTYNALGITASSFDSMMTVMVPATVAPADATVTIVYTAKDSTQQQRSATYQIVVDLGDEPVDPGPGPAAIDNLLIGQGSGGESLINWKNIDPNVTEIDGRAVGITSTYRSVNVAKGPFLTAIGGGSDRAAYTSTGDIDADGDIDVVASQSAITSSAIFPNVVVVKDGKTRELIGNSFNAFTASSYANGDAPIAVGNFIGSTSGDQIAVAQGVGGNNIIRIYQYTGQAAPNGFAVVGQFNGLTDAALTNNANGGLSLAAGDVNGDGNDELVIGQTNSATSRTQFAVIDINADGTVASRMPGVAFPRKFQGNGGIEIAVVDLNGDGVNELVFASAGNTKDFTENIDNRNDAVSNVIAVQVPVVEAGVITGYTRPSGFLRNVFPEDTNPSGAQTIAAIEADGTDDGTELVIGTNAVFNYDSATTTVTAVKAAAQARYTFIKVGFVDGSVTGVSAIVGLGQAAVGFPAFPADLNPSSGGVYVSSGNTD